MKKLALVAVGLAALVTASLAVARSMDYYKSVTAVSGTFAATTISGKTDTRTCTTTDGKTITSTRRVLHGHGIVGDGRSERSGHDRHA